MNFLFWVFLIGIIVASLQDLKRREVDNWLNLFLILISFSSLFFIFGNFETLSAPILLALTVLLLSYLYFGKDDVILSFLLEKGKKLFGKRILKEPLKSSFEFGVIFLISILVGAVFYFNNLFWPDNFNHFGILLASVYLLSNVLFYGRVFAGGDAKLFFAMTVVFIGITLTESILNVFLFIVILMMSGSIYGILYSLVLYSKNYKKVNLRIRKLKKSSWMFYFVALAVVLGIASFYNLVFIILALVVLLFPLLYIFAKGLEEVVMTRLVNVKDLVEGDWLAQDVKIGKVIIESKWEGLTKGEIKKLIKGSKEKVSIKEGLPFVPAFLIAFLVYWLAKESILNFLL